MEPEPRQVEVQNHIASGGPRQGGFCLGGLKKLEEKHGKPSGNMGPSVEVSCEGRGKRWSHFCTYCDYFRSLNAVVKEIESNCG